MPGSPISAADAAREAMEFTRSAWRRLWGVQLLAAAGPALVFLSVRGPFTPAMSAQLWALGWIIAFAAWAPLWAGTHRLALGGAAANRIWLGGLQFGPTECRLLVLGFAASLGIVLSLLPLVAVSAGVFIFARGLGRVAVAGLGRLQVSFLIAAGIWISAGLAMGYVAARFAFSPPATVARRRLALADTWFLTQGRVSTIVAARALAQAPALLVFALMALVDSLELQDVVGDRTRWPLPDAIAGGTVLGLVTAFLQVPLTAGVLACLYQDQRARRASAAAGVSARRSAPGQPESGAFPTLRALS